MWWLIGVDVIVGGGRDRRRRRRAAWSVEPVVGDRVEVLVEGAGDDPPVGLVGVEGARVAVSQLQGRGGFPAVGEAVDAFAARSSGRWRTARRTCPPRPTACSWRGSPTSTSRHCCCVGELGEAVQVGGAEHPGLVDDERRAGGSRHSGRGRRVGPIRGAVWRRCRRASRSRVRGHGPPSRSGRRRTPGDRGRGDRRPRRASIVVLPVAGRADDHHQPVVAGDRRGGVGLQHVEPVAVDRGRRCGLVESGRRAPR